MEFRLMWTLKIKTFQPPNKKGGNKKTEEKRINDKAIKEYGGWKRASRRRGGRRWEFQFNKQILITRFIGWERPVKLLIVMPEADRKNRGREEERCGGGGTKADQSRLNKRRDHCFTKNILKDFFTFYREYNWVIWKIVSHINDNIDTCFLGLAFLRLQSWPSVKLYFTTENGRQRRQNLSEAAPLQPHYTSGLSGTWSTTLTRLDSVKAPFSPSCSSALLLKYLLGLHSTAHPSLFDCNGATEYWSLLPHTHSFSSPICTVYITKCTYYSIFAYRFCVYTL